MAGTKRLLICYAHPDDESFGNGPFIARCTAEGIEVSLICATNGEAGTVAPERLVGFSSIAELRLAELDCAAEILGFKEVINLGYRDSGMMHDTAKDHPETFWSAPLDEVTSKVVEVMRRIRPQVVLTFDPYGGYGHPDHIKIHKATHAAFDLLQDDPNCPQKLYYSVFPKELMQLGVRLMRLSGKDPRRMGVNKDLDFQAVLDHVPPVTALVDVAAYREKGQLAANCHASQISPRTQFPFGKQLQDFLMRKQRFSRAIPALRPGEPLEFDLFTGVRF